VAGPLVAAGLIADNGLTLTSGQIALVAVVLAATSPAITASIARAKSQRDNPERSEEPE
jgi:multisubunit Na+/H+ antiporter MnhG subunit